MNGNPEFSVVIVAYNHARYLAQCIHSVLEQTYPDFEVIVFDDGSTDNTREIVSAISDNRIRYFYQENSGLPACGRNRGMVLAKGKYIALLDGDDFWYKDKLDKCKKVLDSNPDIDLVCHNEDIFYNGKIVRRTSYGPYTEHMYDKLLLEGNCLHASAVIIRRKVFFDDQMRFSEEKDLFTIEDYEYWLRLSQRYRFYFLPDALGCYRVTERGAFLANAHANALNMLRLLDKHFSRLNRIDKPMRKNIRKRRSAIMSAMARTYHHKRDFKKSREWYLMAMREYPFNYKAYIGLLAASANLRIIYK
jgi:glycosyltransferase involved in cell wall biosynthesis